MISPVKVWRRQKIVRELLGKKGTVLSWTTIYTPPPQFKHNAPYVVVLVGLDSRKKIMAQLVDATGVLKKGQEVIIILRKLRESSPEDVIPYTIACKVI